METCCVGIKKQNGMCSENWIILQYDYCGNGDLFGSYHGELMKNLHCKAKKRALFCFLLPFYVKKKCWKIFLNVWWLEWYKIQWIRTATVREGAETATPTSGSALNNLFCDICLPYQNKYTGSNVSKAPCSRLFNWNNPWCLCWWGVFQRLWKKAMCVVCRLIH